MKQIKSLLLSALAMTFAATTSQAATQGKTYQGIYALGYVQMPGMVMKLDGPLWQADYISGVALRASWSAIQSSKGAFDWNQFDQGVALAAKYNKKVSLSITPGVYTPSWTINEGAATMNIVTATSPTTTRSKMVLPWDPIFLREWSTLVKAEAARYDANPNVGYVTMGGPGTFIETFVVQNQQDYNTFVAAGGLAKWIQGSEAIIDMYGSSFKNTPFIVALGNPVINVASANVQGQAAVQTVINYGMAKYPGRFGIGSHALESTSLTQKSNYFVNQDIMQDSPTAPTGFQMISAATNSANNAWSVGNLGQATAAGMQMGGQFIEVYLSDCQNPAYTAMLRSANSQMNAQ